MPLTRVDHWAERAFHEFLLARADMPFVWGTNDCALFAADGIQAITGVDIAEEFRGQYTNEIGAFRLIQTLATGTTVADAAAYCATKHGLVEYAHPLMAQRGDLVVVTDAGRLISGLIHLSGRHVVTVGEDGLKRLPITAVTRAWKI